MALSVTNTTTYTETAFLTSENFEILGAYTGNETAEFQIRITSVSPLKFEWVKDTESVSGSWSSEINAVATISGGVYLADGISVGMTQSNNYWAVSDRVKFTFDKGARKFNDIQIITPDEGLTSIVGYSNTTGTFSTTKDDGNDNSTVIGHATSANNKITSLNHNSSLLYGFGGDAQSIPKRIGYQRYKQFNNSFKPNELFLENSVTNLPDNFTAPHDAEEITVSYYANTGANADTSHSLMCLIEKNTPFMHLLFYNTTNENYQYLETVNLNDFDIVNPIAMTTDGVNVYILDNVMRGVIHILRPEKTTNTAGTDNATHYATTWTSAFFNLPWNGYLTENAYYSDILINKSAEGTWEDKLWVAVYKPYQQGKYCYIKGDATHGKPLVYTADITNKGGHKAKNLLASLDIIASTNKIILTSKMPSVTNWFSEQQSGYNALASPHNDDEFAQGWTTNRIVQTYEKSLIRMGDTANTVGWICNYAHTGTWFGSSDNDREFIMEEWQSIRSIKNINQANGSDAPDIAAENKSTGKYYRIYSHMVVNVLSALMSEGAGRMKLPIKTQTSDIEYLSVTSVFYRKDADNKAYLFIYDGNTISNSKDIKDLSFAKEYILEAIWVGVGSGNDSWNAFESNDALTGTMSDVAGGGLHQEIESNGLMNFAFWQRGGVNNNRLYFKYGFKPKYLSTYDQTFTSSDTQIATKDINSATYVKNVLAFQNASSNFVYTRYKDATTPVDNLVINAKLAQTKLTPTIDINDAEGTFIGGDSTVADSDVVYYKYSYTYDGFQETQLSSASNGIKNTATSAGVTGHENFHVDIDLEILGTRPLSKRISGINVYRSHNKDAAQSTEPDEYFRLIKTIELKSNLWSLESDGYWKYTFKDTGKSGPTYESITGIPETLENLQPHYTLSTEGSGSMFIGNCWHYNLGSVPTYIFKSKPNRYNIYDWTSDFVILPEPPKELAFWAGKLFAFTENKTFQINSETLSIEDTLEGTGGIASIVTDYGMFFCDNYTIYHHDGSKINNIGSIVNSIDEPTSFNNRDLSYIPKLAFDARRKILCVVFKPQDIEVGYTWAYSVNAKRWDLWQIGFSDDYPLTLASNQRGEIIYSTRYGGLYKYLGGSGKRYWQWISKYITLGQDTIDKTFWKIRAISEGLVSIFYSIDNTNVVSLDNEKLASGSKNKGIKLKIIGSTGTTDPTLDSIGLIYRRRPIK